MIRESLSNLIIDTNTNTITSNEIYYCSYCRRRLHKSGYQKRKILNIYADYYYVQVYKCNRCEHSERIVAKEWIPYRVYTEDHIMYLLCKDLDYSNEVELSTIKRLRNTITSFAGVHSFKEIADETVLREVVRRFSKHYTYIHDSNKKKDL